MTATWNIIKYPMLTLLVVVEFFIIASFSVSPIEHSLLMWLVTGVAFAMYDESVKENEKKNRSAN
ncbi:hypothetical protein E4T86_04295 [Mammaliicoccus sciuri]|uniref:hypothetical protein n=1 Tax=Mammaliicoccus sciuri TaxID=1296 RepID=UPI0010718443|nr:hypothetical protein [Mammaliicoccus sciuri]MBF0773244.1 hypothetical protein [Mammaliicoccus sciuri]TFU88266.1 hypothetical protein E4T86_04295 [Mammaliicoccus sciuri]